MRWTTSEVYQILGVDPLTLEWRNVTEETKVIAATPRAVLKGEVDGFFVDVYVYDSDLYNVNDDGSYVGLGNIETGVFQFFAKEMLEHGIQPARRERTNEQASNTQQSKRWECPVHGSQSVYPNNFDKSKLNCTRWQAVSEGKPDWAQDRIANVNGSQRYYCKHKE